MITIFISSKLSHLDRISRIFGVVLACLALIYISVQLVSISRSGIETRIQYIPDDTFYYLTLAKNFAEQGVWSFDSGISRTSGFHLFHAYCLTFIYWLCRPNLIDFITLGQLLSFLPGIFVLGFGILFAYKSKSPIPILLGCLFILSYSTIINLFSALEWAWALSFSMLYLILYYKSNNWNVTTSGKPNCYPFLLFFTGLLGSFSRSDFGILCACLFLVSLLFAFRYRTQLRNGGFHLQLQNVNFSSLLSKHSSPGLLSAAFGLGGASIGVLFIFVHNKILSGQYMQSSAMMKSLWGEFSTPSVQPILNLILGLFSPAFLKRDFLVALLLACSVFIIFRTWLELKKSQGDNHGLNQNKLILIQIWIACIVTVIVYILIYSRSPNAVQIWYTANIFIPLFLIFSIPWILIEKSSLSTPVCLLALLCLLFKQAQYAKHIRELPPWPDQLAMLHAGQFLAKKPLPGRVGSWNAGIIGYFEGGRVINLDGLVNNDIYSYARKNTLVQYIRNENVVYILDFADMLTNEEKKSRGGYNDSLFLSSLSPIQTFHDEFPVWKRLTLYQVAINFPF